MLIVLGGLASLPTEPYESALIDGASQWQMFRHITWPLVLPFVMVARRDPRRSTRSRPSTRSS